MALSELEMEGEDLGLAPPSPAAVRRQLAKIVSSLPFIRSNRIGDFLTFVIVNTLEGELDVLKEVCIGSMVFGRDAAYDPKTDPIVRVEARRLRSKLQEYYETEGQRDTIYITLPKGGYRPLIVTREVAAEDAVKAIDAPQPASAQAEATAYAPAAAPAAIAPPAPRSSLLVMAGAAALGLLCLAAVAIWIFRYRSDAHAGERLAPLTSYVGQEFQPALSPNGRHLAFVWDGDGASSNYDIYVKQLPQGDPIRITTNPAHDLHPAWSPDGRDLAFLRLDPSGAKVIVVPATGGPERVVGELHSVVSVWQPDATQIVGSLGPTWSPDGSSLLVSDNGSIYAWPVAFDAHRRITQAPEGSNDFYPAVSPDGRSLAFVRQTSHSTADLYVANFNGPALEPRRLTGDKSDIRGLSWTPDGKSIVFASARQGDSALWKIALSDAHIEAVPTNSTQSENPSLTAHGDLLAYTELTQNTNIWRIPLGDETHPEAQRLIASSRRNNSPQYAPDGQHIAFISDRSGAWELWLANADGSAPHQLTEFRGPLLGTPHWSPDSQTIAFDARPGEHSAIFVMNPFAADAALRKPRQLAQNSFEERMPNWSGDGRFLYFNSTRSGTVRLWKIPYPFDPARDKPIAVTTRPAYDVFEADGGRDLYFRSDSLGIWRVPTAGGTESLVPELARIDPSRYLAASAHAFYFVDREATPRSMKAFHFDTRKVTTVGRIERSLVSGTPSLSISPDEKYLIYAQQDESGSDILAVRFNSRH